MYSPYFEVEGLKPAIFLWVVGYLFMGYIYIYSPRDSLDNTINTMRTRLGVHPIVPRKGATANVDVPFLRCYI